MRIGPDAGHDTPRTSKHPLQDRDPFLGSRRRQQLNSPLELAPRTYRRYDRLVVLRFIARATDLHIVIIVVLSRHTLPSLARPPFSVRCLAARSPRLRTRPCGHRLTPPQDEGQDSEDDEAVAADEERRR